MSGENMDADLARWVVDEVFQVLLQNPSDRRDLIQEKYDQLVQRIQQMQEIKNQ